jgi:hypothetical protein
MRQAQAVYEKFYMVVTANRKLRWSHSLGTVVVSGTGFSTGSVDIVMSELQCTILMCMNDHGGK